jgi:hypothetical protein
MTLAEAHDQFTALAQKVSPGRTPAELAAISADLNTLLHSLPNTEDFDAMCQQITGFSKLLSGQMSQAVLADLQSRSAALSTANKLLTDTATTAAADARVLTFEKPRLIAATLTTALTTAQQMRTAISSGNYSQALEKAQALETLFLNAQSTIKG